MTWIQISSNRWYNKFTGEATSLNPNQQTRNDHPNKIKRNWSLAQVMEKRKKDNELRALEIKQRLQSLLVLQCFFRCESAYKKAQWKRAKKSMKKQIKDDREFLIIAKSAAIVIQRYQRGIKGREKVRKIVQQSEAATTIQRIGRGRNQRARMKMVLVISSVLAIQCALRVWKARTKVEFKNQQMAVRHRFHQKKQQQQMQQQQNYVQRKQMVPQQQQQQPSVSKELIALNLSDELRINIGMVEDELKLLKPMMDSAALIIQRQYHCLRARRKFEWKKHIRDYKLGVQPLHATFTTIEDLDKLTTPLSSLSPSTPLSTLSPTPRSPTPRSPTPRSPTPRSPTPPTPPPDLSTPTNALDILNKRQNSIQLHAHCACMLIQATYRSYRSRLHLKWIKETMDIVLSRTIPYTSRPLILPSTFIVSDKMNDMKFTYMIDYQKYLNNHYTCSEQTNAATMIQSFIRMLLSKDKIKWKKFKKNYVQEKKNEENNNMTMLNQKARYKYTESPVEDVFYALSSKKDMMSEKDLLLSLSSPRLIEFISPLMYLMESLLPVQDVKDMNDNGNAGDTIDTAYTAHTATSSSTTAMKKTLAAKSISTSSEFLKQLLQPKKYRKIFKSMLLTTSNVSSINLKDFEQIVWYGIPVENVLMKKKNEVIEKSGSSNKNNNNRFDRMVKKRNELLPIPYIRRMIENKNGKIINKTNMMNELTQRDSTLKEKIEEKEGKEEKEKRSLEDTTAKDIKKETVLTTNDETVVESSSNLLNTLCSPSIFPRESAPFPDWLNLDKRAIKRIIPKTLVKEDREKIETNLWITKDSNGHSILDCINDGMIEEEEGINIGTIINKESKTTNVEIHPLKKKTKKKKRKKRKKKVIVGSIREQLNQQPKEKSRSPTNESTTLRTLMSGSNLSLFQADFMLSVLGPSNDDITGSVLLSPGRINGTMGAYNHNDGTIKMNFRPSSATKEYHKKSKPEVVETYNKSSLVFPWQSEMFTVEWNKIVASGVRSGGGGSGGGKKFDRPSNSRSSNNDKKMIAGLNRVLKDREKLNLKKKMMRKKWREELKPLPNAKDLMERCKMLRETDQKKEIEMEKRRLIQLYMDQPYGTLKKQRM
jgi:hypothetical protein